MSFVLTYLLVLTTLVCAALFSLRRFFLMSEAGGYVFIALNWSILAIASILLTLLLNYAFGLF